MQDESVRSATARTSVDRLDTRIAHLQRLIDPQQGMTFEKANEAFRGVVERGAAPDSVLVRRGFLARQTTLAIEGDRDNSPRAKPPLASAIRGRGVTLRLQLTLLMLVQCQRRLSARIPFGVLRPHNADADDHAALGLIDFFATGNKRRAKVNYRRTREGLRVKQMTNALDNLASAELQLVELGDGYEQMWLNQETGPRRTGDVRRYQRPNASEKVISVPLEFFTKGWIQVMSDSEMANWLMWRDVGDMRDADTTSTEPNLLVDADTRLGVYDLTRDTWDTHHVLTRLGLIDLDAGEVDARDTSQGLRFRRQHHRFGVNDAVLTNDAHAAMLSTIAALREEAFDGRAGGGS